MELLVILGIVAVVIVRLLMACNEPSRNSGPDVEPGAGTGADYSVNPATGLPMILEEPFGFDIAGNPYGMDQSYTHARADPHSGLEAPMVCINPATGLPMTSGREGGVDVAGNPYGANNDDLFSNHHDASGNDAFGSGMGADSYGSGDSFGSFGSGSGSDWS